MNPRLLLLLTAVAHLAQAAVAQDPADAVEKAHPTPRTTVAAPPFTMQPWRAPVYDADANGVIYTAAPSFKAEFRADQVVFTPFLGSDLPTNLPVAFGCARVTLAGEPLVLADAVANRDGDTVRYERGVLREEYLVRLGGIEQTFVFDTLPQRGELAFAIDVQTDLQPATDTDGLCFTHPRGAVGYTQAIAIDAKGLRLPLSTTCEAGTIRFAVPAEFVANATLPLVVDPVIGTRYTGNALNYKINRKDLAFDESAGEWHVAYGYDYSLTDSDVMVQRFDTNFAPIGNPVVIDSTTLAWNRPAIANLAAYDKFLVVCHTTGSGADLVRGRITQAGSASAAGLGFDIEGPNAAGNLGRPASRCDVGGDPSQTLPTYWTVVFESQSAGDADIYLRQVAHDGSLRLAAPTVVAATSAAETRPRISKSNGQGSSATQAWAIVYHRSAQGSNSLRGRSVTWNGNMVDVSKAVAINVDSGREYAISSPTDVHNGVRRFLLTYEAPDATLTSLDIYGKLFDRALEPLGAPASLTAMVLSPAQNGRDQTNPSVDCDGTRFVVAYTDHFSATDRDVRVATFQRYEPANLRLAVASVDTLANAGIHEERPAVCARRSGNGPRVDYAIVWQAAATATADRLEGVRYRGHQTGTMLTTRATGCGTLGIGSIGEPFSGETFTVTRTGGQGLGGFVVGYPATIPLGNCPGCTLGVDGNTQLSADVPVAIPVGAVFLGMTLSFQAFDLGVGPCLSQVSLSDTLDATIR